MKSSSYTELFFSFFFNYYLLFELSQELSKGDKGANYYQSLLYVSGVDQLHQSTMSGDGDLELKNKKEVRWKVKVRKKQCKKCRE